jgi:type I restriction enzyme S subunit
MGVVEAYQQTEVGVFPKNWQVKPLSSLTDPNRPISYGIVQTGPNVMNGVPCIRVVDISNGRVSKKDLITTTPEISSSYKRTILKAGDLVMPLRGKVGEIGSIDDELIGANLTRGVALIAITKDFHPHFFQHFISSARTRNRLEQSMNGSALQEIPIASLRSFKVAFPPTKAEQEAIATAFSDADALIESLEQLIAKKRLIKQGAMQELLTGKRRLPGFALNSSYTTTEIGTLPSNWETPKLAEIILTTQLGGNYKNSLRENSWPLIKMGNLGRGVIKLDKIEYIDTGSRPLEKDLLKFNDLLLNTRNTLELVGKVALWREELQEAYFNSNIMRIEFLESKVASKQFLNYILNTPRALASIRSIAIGTTSVAAVYNRDLMNIQVPLPPKDEQVAIAGIIEDMDVELHKLESKLTKARKLKQGMMQELLTGRIRLI